MMVGTNVRAGWTCVGIAPVTVLVSALGLGSFQARAAEGGEGMLRWVAEGVQIYACSRNQDRYAWILQRPDAALADRDGVRRAHHGAGPSWQAADGSVVFGTVLSSVPAPMQGSIPWLVLRASAHDGNGLMSGVAYILRTDTVGGVAPATGCDAANSGAELPVAYRATYVFLLQPGLLQPGRPEAGEIASIRPR